MKNNADKVTLELTRIELCDLMLACTFCDCETDDNTTKWARLHDNLKKILDEFDNEEA